MTTNMIGRLVPACAMLAIVAASAAHAETLAEIDLNPIKALASGCVVVDALIVTRRKE